MKNYEELVYAGVLGKVIGVYMGRPFEGWSKAVLEKKWGLISGYVHEDLGKPLVVSDDDISGTFTFIRALEDSGRYQNTPPEFYGDNWLNYILENKTILWWGGMGFSTEHTAFLRLKDGIKAPLSGSIALNGRTVAEQIGAQIFIDAFGLVAPGKPELAARMARHAASVSHDGEAVHAAVVVAAMVSAAFTEKRMDKLLDIGVSLIPGNSLIAKVHRDVRAWCKADRDWHKTYSRIDRKYGYGKYGGNCHVIPNHAIMVMAWCYAPDDFYEAQRIINTAGWDTDCNAANVGSVMGVKVGLKGINARYDFQAPFADRILLPTADGTRSTSDCLMEALHIARIGRKVMGWAASPPPKKGVWHHFDLPGARHGYMSESDPYGCRNTAIVENVAGHSQLGRRSLRITFNVDAGHQARISTPVLARPDVAGYSIVSTSQLYSGMNVKVTGLVGVVEGAARARLFVRVLTGGKWSETTLCFGKSAPLKNNAPLSLTLTVPDTKGCAVLDFGIEICSTATTQGELFVDCVHFSGKAEVAFPAQLPRDGDAPGWIRYSDHLGGSFSDDPGDFTHAGKNTGRGILVTGNTGWKDYTFEANVKIHLADKGGILVRYQGMQRYIALVRTNDHKFQLIERHYGDTILAETASRWKLDQPHSLRLVCKGRTITAFCDGRKVLEGVDNKLGCGGAGLIFEKGMIGFNSVKVS
ncbi:MAG: ADP-ribosylglycohydrolase family protein [bacterium]